MNSLEVQKYRVPVCDIAKRAADAILEIYRQDFSVEKKLDHSPITAADLAAHRVIVDSLRLLTPELPILSEESKAIRFEQRSDWNRYWLVDPLDGTREFVKRNGEFTVNIALIDNGKTIMGVVLAPVTGYLAHAVKGQGSYSELNGTRTALNVTAPRDSGPWRIAGSRSHGDARTKEFYQNIGACDVLPMGSSLKFCMVAEGKADLYPRFGPTSEWDTAAGQCVLEEAGGQVTDLNLNALTYNQRDTLLNPEFVAFAALDKAWSAYL